MMHMFKNVISCYKYAVLCSYCLEMAENRTCQKVSNEPIKFSKIQVQTFRTMSIGVKYQIGKTVC